MAQDATLHVKIDSATNEELSRLAAARNTSKGQLVRDAIFACYRVPLSELSVQQRRALAAYLGGSISHRQARGSARHARPRSQAVALRARHRTEHGDLG